MKKCRRNDVGIFYSIYETSTGFGGVVASSEGLIEVLLPVSISVDEIKSQIKQLYPRVTGENTLTGNAAELLRDYFNGQKVSFELPLDLGNCTEFSLLVYKSVSRIPYGSVKNYAEVAAETGSPKASRGVGSVMAGNTIPIIIPCHRVIGSDGKMTGYSAPGGTEMKSILLQMEGIRFEKGGKKAKR
ncbi:MAG TPA: methylated-DNA--[protein]-cysteine S-methyltransferase [Geobacteraceae bacterium]|nr:methylated-DNA--[protein]-cysteine S-methyltransferase [Geobacteraceae bacterium]